MYEAEEFDVAGLVPTGRKLYWRADGLAQAVAAALYAARLRNGSARVGPTGRVVYCGDGLAWALKASN